MKGRVYKIFVLFLVLSLRVFSQFEVGFNIPIGFGITFANSSIVYRTMPPTDQPISTIGFMNIEIAALGYAGYNFSITNVEMVDGIGLFFETGYYLHSFNTQHHYNLEYSGVTAKSKYMEVLFLHSINIGILSKVNLKNSAIGLGGGIRVPVAGFSEFYDQYSSVENLPSEEVVKHNYKDLKDTLKYLVAPYIKLTSEFRFPVKNKRVAPTLSTYFAYDFGVSYKLDEINKDLEIFEGSPYFKKFSQSSFSLGVQLGLSFR